MSNTLTKDLTVLGNKVDGTLTKDQLEFFPNPSSNLREVSFETHEFCSLCPVTNQPDLYTIKITYVPNERCVESKSLKLYLGQWRNQGIFGEAVAATLAYESNEVLQPHSITVEAKQQVRGGLQMTTKASH